MYDIIIKNGEILDGSGDAAYVADVAVRDGKIVKIGKLDGEECRRVIDAEGRCVTPGFFDVHSHGDGTIMMFPGAESHLMQGITTFIGGLCGDSVAPLNPRLYFRNFWEYDNWHQVDGHLYEADLLQDAQKSREFLEKTYNIRFNWETFEEYLSMLEELGMSINFIPLVGHSEMRVVAMDTISDQRRPSAEELQKMRLIAEEAMEAGAWGFSTGLDYAPSKFAYDEEIDAVLDVVKKHDGFYSTHWRTSHMHADPFHRFSKKDGLLHACETARRNGVRAEISHLSSVYEIYPWGTDRIERTLADETMKIVDEYNANGADLVFNIAPNTTYGFKCVPYLIMYFAPLVKQSGGPEQFIENLKYKEYVEDVRKLILSRRSRVFAPAATGNWGDRITVTQSRIPGLAGHTIRQLADQKGLSCMDTVFELLRQDPYINVKEDVISYAAVEEFLSHEKCMVCLDGYIFDNVSTFGVGKEIPEILPNPTGYCGFPLFLKKFGAVGSREEKIRKITGNVAAWYGIENRGLIKEGYWADINVIDMDALDPREDHIHPMTYPKGIEYVIVNGEPVVEDGVHTQRRAGRVLRKNRKTE